MVQARTAPEGRHSARKSSSPHYVANLIRFSSPTDSIREEGAQMKGRRGAPMPVGFRCTPPLGCVVLGCTQSVQPCWGPTNGTPSCAHRQQTDTINSGHRPPLPFRSVASFLFSRGYSVDYPSSWWSWSPCTNSPRQSFLPANEKEKNTKIRKKHAMLARGDVKVSA